MAFVLATHAPEFRAQHVKLIYQTIAQGRNYDLELAGIDQGGDEQQIGYRGDGALHSHLDDAWRAAAETTISREGGKKRIAIVKKKFGDRPWFKWLLTGKKT